MRWTAFTLVPAATARRRSSCGVSSPSPAAWIAGSKTRRRQLRSISTPPRGAVKTRSVGALPTPAAASAWVSDRATGTDRHWWDLGVPKIITPSTSITDSSNCSRRRSGPQPRLRTRRRPLQLLGDRERRRALLRASRHRLRDRPGGRRAPRRVPTRPLERRTRTGRRHWPRPSGDTSGCGRRECSASPTTPRAPPCSPRSSNGHAVSGCRRSASQAGTASEFACIRRRPGWWGYPYPS